MAIFPNIDRRQLLTSAGAVTVARPSLTNPHTKALIKSEIVPLTKASLALSAEARQNFATVTVLHLREIAERNVIRQEAGLPLLSIAKELRRMKEAADAEKFRKFADSHRKSVHDKMLARVRRRYGDPNWLRPACFREVGCGLPLRRTSKRESCTRGLERVSVARQGRRRNRDLTDAEMPRVHLCVSKTSSV
jgi:hypothetical protein